MLLVHVVLPLALVVSPPAGIVVLGDNNVVGLLAAKQAARLGYSASFIARDSDRDREIARKWMYGEQYAAQGVDTDGRAKLITTSSEIGAALSTSEAIIMCADKGGANRCEAAIDNAPALRRVVLLSAVGGTKDVKSFFGGGENAIKTGEEALLKTVAARGIDVSVVRVGVLKGGGVAGGFIEDYNGPLDVGLDATYYNSLFELEEALCTQAYDKFTLGASLSPGDTVDARNMFMRMVTRGSFDPVADEASRINAASALLACLRHPTAISITVSSAAARAPPSEAEWDSMLAAL